MSNFVLTYIEFRCIFVISKTNSMKNFSKELIGASTIPIILSVLRRQKSYGYEIIQQVKQLSNDHISYGEGTLYPVLHKLEKKGLIESSWEVANTGRKRKYYEITENGKKALQDEKENWSIINQIILKLWKIEPSLT